MPGRPMVVLQRQGPRIRVPGIRTDAGASDDATGPPNSGWDTSSEAAAATFDEGWTAEIRIPFSSLAFQPDEDDPVIMGPPVWRSIARKNERVTGDSTQRRR